jgi:hypothetical protein
MTTSTLPKITDQNGTCLKCGESGLFDPITVRQHLEERINCAKHFGHTSVKLKSARDLYSAVFPERKWIAKPLIPAGSVSFFAGKRGCAKTWAALDLALSVANGTLFLGKFETSKLDVLYLDFENGEQTVHERLNLLCEAEILPINLEFAFFQNHLKLDSKDGIDYLSYYLLKHPSALIIVDTFRRVVGVDENDAQEVNNALMLLKTVAEQHGASFVLLHHMRKGFSNKNNDDLADEMRGSSEMANIADSIIAFERNKKDPKTVIMRHQKSRIGVEHDPCRLELIDTEDTVQIQYVGTFEELENLPEKAAKDIMEWILTENLKKFKTIEATEKLQSSGFNKKTVGRALKLLVDTHKLTKPSKGLYSVQTATLANFETNGQNGQMDLNTGDSDV